MEIERSSFGCRNIIPKKSLSSSIKKKKKKFKIEMGNRSRPLQKFATSVSVAVGGILL